MNYLVNDSGEKQIYYFKQYEGICMLSLETKGGREKRICSDGTESFFVYRSNDGVTHLITVSKDSKLVYMVKKENDWRRYEIGIVKPDIKVKKIMIGVNSMGQSMFYSALYHGEYILVHCILGDNAMPATVDNLKDENFFVHKTNVYYTNSNGIMGYKSFADGKPMQFVYCGEGTMPYADDLKNNFLLVYKKEEEICVNGKTYCSDRDAQYPIITDSEQGSILLWKNGDYIKAIPYGNDFVKRTARSSAYGARPMMFAMSDGIRCNYYYGVLSGEKLKIFYSKDPFAQNEENSRKIIEANQREEIEKLKSLTEQLKEELATYKNEILRLNELLKETVRNNEKENLCKSESPKSV